MSVSGLCQICQAEQAVERCPHCGNLVCEDHYDHELGACSECAAQQRRGGGRTL